MAIDRYGHEISTTPHNDVIVGSDGIPLPSRRVIKLGSGLTAVDNPTSDSTDINAAGGGGVTLGGVVAGPSGANSFTAGAVATALSATSPGLAMIQAATAAAQWALLVNEASKQEQYRAIAQTRLGLTAATIKDSYRNWAELGYAAAANNEKQAGFAFTISGSAAAGTSLGQGQLTHATGATASSLGITYGPGFLPRVDTGKGYWRARLKFNTAIDAQTNVGWYLYSTGSSSMGIAQIGSLSTSSIIFQYDGNIGGAKLDLLTTDTAYHNYEVWWLGDGVVHVAVDGVEIGTGVTPGAPIQTILKDFIYYTNGSTAANRSVTCANWYVACVAP